MPEAAVGVTVREALAAATASLEEAGCSTPRLDAELLLAEALGVGRERLVLDAAAALAGDARERFEALLRRRLAREPVAYILGRKEFRQITVSVDRRVLIPRPETELLVEVGLGLPAGARVVDVGTGSGAVALALKDERPDLELWATEIDPGALAVARANRRRLGLEVRFVQADLLDGVDAGFGAVLANLPYVPDGAELAPEISRYEPAGALFAGTDGLDAIRRLVGMVGEVPLIALEVGVDPAAGTVGADRAADTDQASTVAALLRSTGFPLIEVLRDLSGHERVVVARRRVAPVAVPR